MVRQTIFFKNRGGLGGVDYRMVNITVVPWKNMQLVLTKAIFRKQKMVTGNTQHWFTKNKLYWPTQLPCTARHMILWTNGEQQMPFT